MTYTNHWRRIALFLFSAGSIILTNVMAHAVTLLVTNEMKQPLVGAKVIVGYDLNDPFQNNFVTTNNQGLANLSDKWDLSLPIIISAPGYLTTSYQDSLDKINTIQLTQIDLRQNLEVKGDGINFGNLKTDGKVDFAIVYPAFTYSQFSRFDVTTVLSNDYDILKIMGREIAVPSNVSLPRQTENYVLPINFNKPTYRMNFKATGDFKMMANRGQFPLKQVVSDLSNGKTFFDVIKYFRVNGGGEKTLNVNGPVNKHDIDVNMYTFADKLPVRAADIIPKNAVQLSFSVMNDEGLFSATDIKQLDAGQTAELSIPSNALKKSLVSLILGNNDNLDIRRNYRDIHKLRVARSAQVRTNSEIKNIPFDPVGSAYFLLDNFSDEPMAIKEKEIVYEAMSLAKHPDGVDQPKFLSFVAEPVVVDRTLTAEPPTLIEGIEPVATRVFVSEVDRVNRGSKVVNLSYRKWEVTKLGWVNSVTIPKHFGELDPGKLYKWEIFYTGRMTNSQNEGEYILDDVTHVTRNSIIR